MRARDIVRQFDLDETQVETEVDSILNEGGDLDQKYDSGAAEFTPNKVVTGRIVDIRNDEVVVDIGYKSEGIIPANEFNNIDEVDVDDMVDVLLESVDEAGGGVQLSKRRADRIKGWERIVKTYGEGDDVRGHVVKKIKGGLLVDIGVHVFLPASQVSIRRTNDISEFIGRDIEARIIKIDHERMNIVISRRKLIEEQREEAKKRLLEEIKAGQIRVGVVKNIADFGAFVDLGGIDGLLHITDMSWSRLTHPSDMLKIDDEVEVMVLRVDHERERIALGLKQKFPSPWETVELKYPVGSRVQGKVVNVMPYGAFVKLEDGIEGLVHISEMSWSKRINHPQEVVKINDDVEVVVLDINRDKQEISLGMKQADGNPWDDVDQRFPPGTVVEGVVRNLTSYGAFVELEDGIDGLLHVSDMSWTKKIANPADMLEKGQHIKAVVLSVHPDKKRIAARPQAARARPVAGRDSQALRPGGRARGRRHEGHQLRDLRRARRGPGGALARLRAHAGRRAGRRRCGGRPRVATGHGRSQDRTHACSRRARAGDPRRCQGADRAPRCRRVRRPGG